MTDTISRALKVMGRALFRQGLAALIGAAAGLTVVGEAADADEARRIAVREKLESILHKRMPARAYVALYRCLRRMASAAT